MYRTSSAYGVFLANLTSSQLQDFMDFPRLFTRVVKNYLHFFGYPDLASQMRYSLIIEHLKPKKLEIVLDVGSGNGIYANQIAFDHGSTTFGIEGRKGRIKKSRSTSTYLNLNSSFMLSNLEKVILKSATYDKVICLEVLEHVKKDKRLLNQIAKCLKKGGTLILTVPKSKTEKVNEYSKYKKFEHVRDGYSTAQIIKLAHSTGFKIKYIDLYFFFFCKNLVKIQQILFNRCHPIVNVLVFPLLKIFSKLDFVFPLKFTGRGIIAVLIKV